MIATTSQELMLAIFLVAAVICDFDEHRIPNAITIVAVATGVLSHLYLSGLQGASFSLQGFGLGLMLLMPFYLLGGMGAGDVKMMGAIGSFVGPQAVTLTTGVALLSGCVMAVGLVLFSLLKLRPAIGGTHDESLQSEVGLHYFTIARRSLKARFPYALAIALGGLAGLSYLRF